MATDQGAASTHNCPCLHAPGYQPGRCQCGVYEDKYGKWCANENCRALLGRTSDAGHRPLAPWERFEPSKSLLPCGLTHKEKWSPWTRYEDSFGVPYEARGCLHTGCDVTQARHHPSNPRPSLVESAKAYLSARERERNPLRSGGTT